MQASVDALRQVVYEHYGLHGRDLPWRKTHEPYHIFVSEIMLQQTQVDRVKPKYESFIARFPTFAALAEASVVELLAEWRGLGYNRRALAMQRAAGTVVQDYCGSLPEDKEALMALPGIGEYTASAIRTFAFDKPDAFIETNIRAVFIHHFFPDANGVTDAELLPLIRTAVDQERPRVWYQALMDYGTYLKRQANPSRRSAHHRPQSRFEGSRRQARGEILRMLLENGPLSPQSLRLQVRGWDVRHDDALRGLLSEGFIGEREGHYRVGCSSDSGTDSEVLTPP